MEKKVICLLGGGQSTEHEISLISATNVCAAISRDKYQVLTVGISKEGNWFFYEDGVIAADVEDATKVHLAEGGVPVFPVKLYGRPVLSFTDSSRASLPFDIIFPVLHGMNGEDGAVQGLSQLLGCPCVGCGMTASAVCMDKAVAKQILEHEGIATAEWILVTKEKKRPDVKDVIAKLGLPIFVKPANAGSSVGVVEVNRPEDFDAALDEAMKYDRKVLVEKAIIGREIECAVLGNSEPFCAVPGEIVMKKGFYSYDAKYNDDAAAELVAPAILPEDEIKKMHALAAKAYIALGCRGMSRVDFFFTRDGEWILNEINTIPGFTKISMYPKLMGLSGVCYSDLVDRLIMLATQ